MLFHSLTFFIFFAAVLAGLSVLRTTRLKHIFLLICSYVFYGWWDWRFCFLMMFSTVSAYVVGLAIARHPIGHPWRKRWLYIGLAADLGVLGFFKYTNFFLSTTSAIFGSWANVGPLSIVLPVGISFFTFETMSYTIDVYRGINDPEKDPVRLALFIAFFPRLVAGPIIRAKMFLPQLRRELTLRRENFVPGSQLFLMGLTKKLLIADRMALFVDPVFVNPDLYTPLTAWLAVTAYAIQIYCDFSGYTDMALGLARILGFEIADNFNMPYISTSITEFWRRWHISLSTWLRDYLYIPLGGNRKGTLVTYRNLMIVMLLGGLWHGASWNFVVWGGIHGAVLAGERYFLPSERIEASSRWGFLNNALGWARTMAVVLIAWVFFRASSFDISFRFLGKLTFAAGGGLNWIYTPVLIVLPVMVVAHVIGYYSYERVGSAPAFLTRRVLLPALYLAGVLALLLFAPENTSPFIYFQF